MTENTLKDLNLEGLYDLLVLCTKEILDAVEKKDEIGLRVRKKQFELLHRVIAAKKAKSLSGS